jgi:hypothetical protein
MRGSIVWPGNEQDKYEDHQRDDGVRSAISLKNSLPEICDAWGGSTMTGENAIDVTDAVGLPSLLWSRQTTVRLQLTGNTFQP